jgi:hypothetical protein
MTLEGILAAFVFGSVSEVKLWLDEQRKCVLVSILLCSSSDNIFFDTLLNVGAATTKIPSQSY